MSDAFLGEVRIFGFVYPPVGWALCQGQVLPVNQYAALFSIVGSYFGGDGFQNFGLPNMTGTCAIGQGQGNNLSPYNFGDGGGQAVMQLSSNNMGPHTHDLIATTAQGTTTASQGNQLATAVSSGGTKTSGNQGLLYSGGPASQAIALSSSAIGSGGGGVPHPNMMPSLVMNFCIALTGIFPQRQ